MNELRGMAAGAEVPFTVALMYTMEEEFSYLVPEALRYSLADHCSDVLIMEDDQRFPSLFLPFSRSGAQRRRCRRGPQSHLPSAHEDHAR